VSLSRGQSVRDEPRTINGDGDVDDDEDKGGGEEFGWKTAQVRKRYHGGKVFHLATLDSLRYPHEILNADKRTRAVYFANKGPLNEMRSSTTEF